MSTLTITIDNNMWETIKDDVLSNYWKFEKSIVLLYNLSKQKDIIYSDIIFKFLNILTEEEINYINQFNDYDKIFLSRICPKDQSFSLSCSANFLKYIEDNLSDNTFVPKDQETIFTPKEHMFIHDPLVPSIYK